MFTRPTMLFVAAALIAASACGGRSTSKSKSEPQGGDDHALGGRGTSAAQGGTMSEAGRTPTSATGGESSEGGHAGLPESGGVTEQGGMASTGGESSDGGDGGAITDGGHAGSLASAGTSAQAGTPNAGGSAGLAQAGTPNAGGGAGLAQAGAGTGEVNSDLKCNPLPAAGPSGCAEGQFCFYRASSGLESSECWPGNGTLIHGGQCVSFACQAGLACINWYCIQICRFDHPEDCTFGGACSPVISGDHPTLGICR